MSGIKEWNKWIRNKDLSAKEEKEKLKRKRKEKNSKFERPALLKKNR